MKTMLDLYQLADLMTRNEGKWMLLDDDGYPGAMASRASSWNHRPPKAFQGSGFRFRTRVNNEKPQKRWMLEGMFTAPTDGEVR